MFVALLVVIILIMDGVVEREAVDVSVDACRDDLGVIVRDGDVLDVVG